MDTEEIENLLQENLRISKDNHRMIKRLHQSMIWSRVINGVYWVIVVASFLGLLYFLQPYVDKIENVYLGLTSGFKKTQDVVESIPDLPLLPR